MYNKNLTLSSLLSYKKYKKVFFSYNAEVQKISSYFRLCYVVTEMDWQVLVATRWKESEGTICVLHNDERVPHENQNSLEKKPELFV